jgi:uncharacterized protein (DUF885 family)
MTGWTRRELLAAGLAFGAAPFGNVLLAQAPGADGAETIEDFFREFTGEWVRQNPSQAASTKYFSGSEQDRLERELTPETLDYRRARIALARRGLDALRRFDRSQLADIDRIAADVMDWQLDMIVRQERFLDYTFPLEQMNGVNVGLVETMTVRRLVVTDRDAENYVAALGQVPARMDEAIAEARRLDEKGIVPPRFILDATIAQMQAFVGMPPAQNPFATALVDRLSAIGSLPADSREQLAREAETIVASQIYPAWTRAIALLQAG